ncbi:hypothetical protein [Metasolibacillus sp. FSL K6-0083]|uniref:hypothetical protein n=1 Tax=Metasolibacillus sp. FSL K6-0083 TaxID=2921416 RepID=UPI003159ADCC
MSDLNTHHEKSSQHTVKKTTESRTTEIHLNPEYIIDRDLNSFQTDEKGTLEGFIWYKYSTTKENQLAVYAFLENDATPVNIEINESTAPYHIINIPKEGGKKVPFTITNLPQGEHMLYIIGEKVLNHSVQDPMEIYDTQRTVARNFLSVKVNNEHSETATISSSYMTAQKIEDLKNETSVIMQMYENSNLIKEAELLNRKDEYFLTIENQYDFELKAHLKLISEYEAFELQQIIVAPSSKVVIPLNFQAYHLMNSARLIMVAAPSEPLHTDYSLRIVKTTKRMRAS